MRESVRRAGQRVLVGFEGFAASGDVKRLIRDFAVSGVVLFARNVDGPEQLAELVRELGSLAEAARLEQPLLVAVDQEGGRVQRLRAPWTLWPPMRRLGETRSADLARRMGAALAAELVAAGIHLDFAPCVDVDTNPANPVIGDRSLGSDPALVSQLGSALVQGLQAGGVAACAKHFPGHGDTDLDSHLDLPSVEHDRARLEAVELAPFRAASAAGVAGMMTSHVVVRSVDESLPATLSRPVVTGLLRDGLSFDGVVFSDDMEMGALARHWGMGDAALRAALAGCDLVCVCKSPALQVEAVEALVRGEESKALPWSEAEASLARIRSLKQTFVTGRAVPNPRGARLAAGGGGGPELAAEILRAAAGERA